MNKSTPQQRAGGQSEAKSGSQRLEWRLSLAEMLDESLLDSKLDLTGQWEHIDRMIEFVRIAGARHPAMSSRSNRTKWWQSELSRESKEPTTKEVAEVGLSLFEDFETVLLDKKSQLEGEVRRRRRAKEVRDALQPSESAEGANTTAGEYDPTKRGLQRELAMMLLDELFPNLEGASAAAKAEFLALLTGWNAEGLRQRWGDYRRANPMTVRRNEKIVTEWRRKLKITRDEK